MRLLAPLPLLAALLPACSPDASVAGDPVLGAVEELVSPAAPGSGEPNLAVAPDGRVLLSWLEPQGDSAHALRFSVLKGAGWSAPRTVASGADWFVNWADFPSMLALPDGRLTAHWLQRSGPGRYSYDVRIAQSADGGATWSPGVVPHRDGTESEHGFVSMWPAAGDSLGAVWLDGRRYAAPEGERTKEMMLLHTRVAADGTLGAEERLDERICDCCQTAVALTSRGPVVAYRDRSADEVRDIYTVRQVDGRWSEPRPAHADGWKIPACPVNGPALAAEGERVALAWFTAAGDTARVRVTFSADAGESWGAPFRIDGGNPAGRVDVEMLPGGHALVSWVERSGGGEGAEVRARTVAADGRLGEPFRVAVSVAARASGFPRMVRSGDTVVFAWTHAGEPGGVRAARIALGGAR